VRLARRGLGGDCALALAGALSGAPRAALSWARAHARAKPQALALGGGGGSSGAADAAAPVNLSHAGCVLAAAYGAPAAARIGVDAQSAARAERALAQRSAGGALGAALLADEAAGGSGAALPWLPAGAAQLPAAVRLALRWTLMEAVLKARGQGLAVEGAGAAVLAGAVRVDGGAAQLAPRVWGACISEDALPGGCEMRVRRAAAAAAAASMAAAGGCGGDAAGAMAAADAAGACGVAPLPFTTLASFCGPGWRATTLLLPPWHPGGEELVVTIAHDL
jgi:hypothetical protein